MPSRVTVFTDTYLPTVNGVTYTVESWRDRWQSRGGSMDIVYPGCGGYVPRADEYPVRSLPFPCYDGFRLGAPVVPSSAPTPDLVHAHTPFGIGLAGRRLASARDVPFVASYHTPTSEYATYLLPFARGTGHLRRLCRRWERWFYSRADVVIAPSEATRRYLAETIDVDAPVTVISNGADVDRFRPVDSTAFMETYDLDDGTPLIGYTGRHGHEKRLTDLVSAVDGMDVTLVLAGDGPARPALEVQAGSVDTEVRFLGFLDREELPAFYAALDVFAFPSPVETQGLVALEANACGTPVVGPDSGALAETIADGETGYHYANGDVDAFPSAIERALVDREQLGRHCLDRRDTLSVERSIDALETLYERLV